VSASAEEFAFEYFTKKNIAGVPPVYTVLRNVRIQPAESEKPSENQSYIDVLAIGKEEIFIVKTQPFPPFKNSLKDSWKPLCTLFSQAGSFVKKNYATKNEKIRKLFITEDFSFIFF
jgi:hypothetical protein